MKKRKVLKLANWRQIIFLTTLCIFMLLAWLGATIYDQYTPEKNLTTFLWHIAIAYVLPFPISFTLSLVGIVRWNWDKKLYHFFYQRQKRKDEKALDQKRAAERAVKKLYLANEILFLGTYTIKVHLAQDVRNNNTIPEVKCNNVILPVIHVADHRVLTVIGEKALSSTQEKVEIYIGSTRYEVDNPYFCSTDNVEVEWQCKGHKPEKNIFVSFNKAQLDNNCTYPFNIYIGGKFWKKVSGEVLNKYKLKLPIPTIKSAQCVDKDVIIKPCWDIGKPIPLPQPTTMQKQVV